jgi:hypothetical protein
MDYLLNALRVARNSEIKDIIKIFATLFGERVSSRTQENFTKRMDQSLGRQTFKFERGTGTIIPVTGTAAAAVVREAVAAPAHKFHCEE